MATQLESLTQSRSKSFLKRVIKLTSNSAYLCKFLFRHMPWLSVQLRVDFDALGGAPYAYGIYKAMLEAKALGIHQITVIEFGVAGGNGLLAMENIAGELEHRTGISVQIFGFDIKEGLPLSHDFRDLSYAWQAGAYKMDEDKLRSRLKRSTLVLGDVSHTVASFLDDTSIPPIGFISFDLDYYSSTKMALQIFEHDFKRYLPRVMCYFDDTVGHDDEYHCKYVGELLAIEEFNERHEDVKVAKINGLRYKRFIPDQWNEGMHVCHFFKNNLYNQYVGNLPGQLPLR